MIQNPILKLRIFIWFSVFWLTTVLLSLYPVHAQSFKWHPGHYVFVGSSDDVPGLLQEIKDFPIIRGMQVRYFWDDLESEKGVYDFSKIKNDISLLQTHGKVLIIQFQYKSFNENQKNIPLYLQTPEYDGGVFQAKKGTWNLCLWNEHVVERFTSLIYAIADAFDSDPGLALLNTVESGPENPPEDSPFFPQWSSYRDKYIRQIVAFGPVLRTAFPNTPIILYNNVGSSYQTLFQQSALNSGAGHGAPDTYPCAYEAGKGAYYGYTTAEVLKGSVPIGYGVQWNNYAMCGNGETHEDPENPMPVLFAFNKDVLGSNFIFWGYRPAFWDQVKAFWTNLAHDYPDDPAGGLHSASPSFNF